MITEIAIVATLALVAAGLFALTAWRRRRTGVRYADPWLVEIEGPRAVRLVCSRCGTGFTWISTRGRIQIAEVTAQIGRDCSDRHPVKLEEAA